jgi:ribosomal protein RSM22 (predicted rRNA methylase)
MTSALTPELRDACEAYTQGLSRAEITKRVAAMSEHYRAGRSSREAIASEEDVAAYLLTRLPATFAAVNAALSAVWRLVPFFDPESLIDLCAGPGTATLAALDRWPGIDACTLIDANPWLLAAAPVLLGAFPIAAPGETELIREELDTALDTAPSADLVLMSYALVELPDRGIAGLARRIYGRAKGIAVFVEPGTPEGHRRLLICRDALIEAGAHLIAPCPHGLPCPMQSPQWCHFGVRLPRTRAHRLAKQAELPFEDEAYAYLAFGRQPPEIAPEARIVSRVGVSKIEASCQICASDGKLAELTVQRRDRERYARLRRRDWGDSWGE